MVEQLKQSGDGVDANPGASPGRLWFHKATPHDAATLLRLIQTAFGEYQGRLDPPSGAHAETERSIVNLLEREHAVLAGVSTEALGCVFYHHAPDETYLHRLAVLPAARRMSLGRALMNYVEARARDAGVARVRLGVRLQLPENQAYYARMGYTVLRYGTHTGYTQPTFVHMVKDVSEPAQRLIEMVPHNPDWARQFTMEAALLRLVFGDQLLAIHHIGSTAIPGIYAKPIIDMLPLVKDIAVVDTFNPVMEALGYTPLGEFGLEGRRYFRKGDNRRSHQAHVYQFDAPDAPRHIIFRDYMLTHPDKAQQYSDLKRSVAQQHPHDIYAYMDGKDAFVKAMEAEALAWRATKIA